MTTLEQFGGVGDNSTNNDVALTNALASAEEPIEIPEGSFVTNKTQDELTDKRFVGPGTIATPGVGTPGNYTRLSTKATALGDSLYGDFSKVNVEKFILDGNVRKGLDEAYYEYSTTPHVVEFNSRSGGTGFLAYLDGNVLAGATAITLNSTDGLTDGDEISLGDAPTNDRVTVSSFDAISKVVNFSPALEFGHTDGDWVVNHARTMNQVWLGILHHVTGGDAYIYGGRAFAYHQIQAGADNFELNSTAGIIGGDVNAKADGVYMTPFEFSAHDEGHDVACIGGLQSLARSQGAGNGGGRNGCVWIGHYIASQPSPSPLSYQPIDSAYYASGKMNVGLDLVLADLTSGCAIGLAQNQYIHFTNTASGTTGVLIGDTIGNTKFGYNSSTGKVELTVGGVLMLSASSTNVTLAGDLASAGSAWTAYTPSAVSSGGAITTLGAHTGRYRKVGKTVNLQTSVNIVANGSADTSIVESLPFQAANAQYVLSVVDTTTGIVGRAIIGANANSLEIKKYDNTYLGGDGATLVVTGVYETA